jgi:hypothetical protein
MATSCVAQKKLFRTTIIRSNWKSSTKSTAAVMSRVTVIMVVQKTIHAFLPPKRFSFTRSISGAQTHLNAQGKKSAATNVPICSRDKPCVRMKATMAVDVNPYGTPSDI